jgi:hypothetical protein
LRAAESSYKLENENGVAGKAAGKETGEAGLTLDGLRAP